MKHVRFLMSITLLFFLNGCTHNLERTDIYTPQCEKMFDIMGRANFWITKQDPSYMRHLILGCSKSIE